MNKKYFIIIQPDDFDCPTKVIDIHIMDIKGAILYHGLMCKEATKIIFDLMRNNTIFITYNGGLLRDMFNQFFCIDYKNIISLMDIFATEYGEYNEYFESYTYKKLEFALDFYGKKGILKNKKHKVDIYDTTDMLINTITLYKAIQLYEEKKQVN